MIVEDATPPALRALLNECRVPVMLDFWRPGCGPCRMLDTALSVLARQRAERLCIVKINVEREHQLAAEYNVRSTPTIVILIKRVVVARRSGAMLPAQLDALLDV